MSVDGPTGRTGTVPEESTRLWYSWAALEAGVADVQGMDQEELTRAVEAADRAGSIVTEHVRSIIDAAQQRAAEIDRTAQQEAESIRTEAYEAAQRVLERIDSLEGQLGGLVNGLREEAGSISGNLDRRG